MIFYAAITQQNVPSPLASSNRAIIILFDNAGEPIVTGPDVAIVNANAATAERNNYSKEKEHPHPHGSWRGRRSGGHLGE